MCKSNSLGRCAFFRVFCIEMLATHWRRLCLFHTAILRIEQSVSYRPTYQKELHPLLPRNRRLVQDTPPRQEQLLGKALETSLTRQRCDCCGRMASIDGSWSSASALKLWSKGESGLEPVPISTIRSYWNTSSRKHMTLPKSQRRVKLDSCRTCLMVQSSIATCCWNSK